MISITGAAGFIGSNLAHFFARQGEKDLVLVDRNLSRDKARNLSGLASFTFKGHEIFLEELESGDLKPRAIFHLGACSDTTVKDWEYLKTLNLEYSKRLWIFCSKEGIPFIYASSAATYGDGSRGFSDKTHPRELRPLNLYGKSKNDFDIWALEQEAKGFSPPRWAGLKFFNVYGPREAHKKRMASVAFHGWNQIKETGEIRLFKSTVPDLPDGGQMRDFVFVEDCVSHMVWLWRNSKESGIFNSGTGTPRTFNDLAKAIFAAMELEPRITYFHMPEDLKGKYQNYTRAEMDKLKEAGFPGRPTPLEEGVRKYVNWLEATGGGK